MYISCQYDVPSCPNVFLTKQNKKPTNRVSYIQNIHYLYIETSNLIAKIRCFCLFSFFYVSPVCSFMEL